ncbi:hypothetical protein K0N88_001191 [Salmonella enterica]|nr:hypothetical protein [Salmonella enterica]
MLLIHIYSNLIGICEERNGKPRSLNDRKAGYEIHHIIARSMGGTNHPNNLVYITPREHFTAHHILARLYGGSLASAFWLMSHKKQGSNNRSYPVTSRQYATAKSLALPFQRAHAKGNKGRLGQPLSDEMKAKISAALKGRVSGMAGKNHSSETKTRIAESSKGRKHTEESRLKMSMALTGLKRSAEQIHRMSESHRGKKASAETKAKMSAAHKGSIKPRFICPHCRGEYAKQMLNRYHGDNCKHKPS